MTFDWNNTHLLDKLEEDRRKRRGSSGELTFDCFKAIAGKDERVYCKNGHCLSAAKDGMMPLVSVLRGMTASECRTCADKDTKDT